MQPQTIISVAWGAQDVQHHSPPHVNPANSPNSLKSPIRVVVHPNAANSWNSASTSNSTAGLVHAGSSFTASSCSSMTSSGSMNASWQYSTLFQNTAGRQYSNTSSLDSSYKFTHQLSHGGMARSSSNSRRTKSSTDLQQLALAAAATADRSHMPSHGPRLIVPSTGTSRMASTGSFSSQVEAQTLMPYRGNGKSSPGPKEIAHITSLHNTKEPYAHALPLPHRGNGRSLPGGKELAHLEDL